MRLFAVVKNPAGIPAVWRLIEGTEVYSYDSLDRLTKATRSDGEQAWAYDAVGNRTMADHGGIARDMQHDPRNRLLNSGLTGSLLVSGDTDEASTVNVNGEPATMLAGNKFEKRVPFSGSDPQSVNVVATDASGNARTSTYSVDPVSEAATYSYDPNGNLAQRVAGADTWTYTWDGVGQLVQVRKNSQVVTTFEYDPVGRRVGKITPASTTAWLLDGMDILRETVTGSSPGMAYYVHGTGIDEPLGKEVSGDVEYYHADGLGSVVKITDQGGAIVHAYEYDVWGNIALGVERPGYAFTGREWDPEIGLYYYRARYYDPNAGRFISEDPIGFGGGPNLFGYAGGNPVFWRDPLGLKPGDPFSTPRQAAVDAYRTMVAAFGKTPGIEWGGLIYSKKGKDGKLWYHATDFRTDGEDNQVDIYCIADGTCSPKCGGLPPGAKQAGEYHTHSTNNTQYGLPAFSPFGDLDGIEVYGKPGPAFVMHKSGDIFEYNKGGTNPKVPFANVWNVK